MHFSFAYLLNDMVEEDGRCASIFLNLNGVEKLKDLQYHPNTDTSKISKRILDTCFTVEDNIM